MAIPGGLVAALVGAGGAAALVLYSRSRANAAEQPATPSDPCAPLKNISDAAYDACRATRGLAGILGGIVDAIEGENPIDKLNRVNVELNGPTKVPMPDVPPSTAGYVAGGYVALQSRTLEHANGCVPIPGQPGWSKCAPGTIPGVATATRRYDAIAADYVPAIHPAMRRELDTDIAAWGKGTARDPLTGPDIRPEGRAANRWFWKGQAVTCPPGQVLSPWSALQDKRNLSAPLCANPDGSGAFTVNTSGSQSGTVATGGQSRPPTTGTGTFCTTFYCFDTHPDDDAATQTGGVNYGTPKPR